MGQSSGTGNEDGKMRHVSELQSLGGFEQNDLLGLRWSQNHFENRLKRKQEQRQGNPAGGCGRVQVREMMGARMTMVSAETVHRQALDRV